MGSDSRGVPLNRTLLGSNQNYCEVINKRNAAERAARGEVVIKKRSVGFAGILPNISHTGRNTSSGHDDTDRRTASSAESKEETISQLKREYQAHREK